MPAETAPANIVPVPVSALPTLPLLWGVVATVKAPVHDIMGFAAHHLSLGAHRVYIYLDDPQEPTVNTLKLHPKIDVTACTPDWWAAQSRPRFDSIERRQMHNATHAYRRSKRDDGLSWLAHIDVDEFILATTPLSETLAAVPSDAAWAQMPSAELLAPETPAESPRYFKRTPRQAGLPSSVREDLYPTYGLHLRGGFLSHIDGKMFARTGLSAVYLGIHALRYHSEIASNFQILPHTPIGHAHAPDWATFMHHLEFRLRDGSYRHPDGRGVRLGDLIDYLWQTDGETALRHLFTEVCTATPELVAALDARDMLIDHPLGLPAKIAQHFPALPPSITGAE